METAALPFLLSLVCRPSGGDYDDDGDPDDDGDDADAVRPKVEKTADGTL